MIKKFNEFTNKSINEGKKIEDYLYKINKLDEFIDDIVDINKLVLSPILIVGNVENICDYIKDYPKDRIHSFDLSKIEKKEFDKLKKSNFGIADKKAETLFFYTKNLEDSPIMDDFLDTLLETKDKKIILCIEKISENIHPDVFNRFLTMVKYDK